jgi:thioredoxin 1
MGFLAVEMWTPAPPLAAPPIPDWLLHGAGYTVLGVLLAIAGLSSSGRGLAVALATGVLWGSIQELGQRFVPGRTATFTDWLANSLGVAVGVEAVATLWRRLAASSCARARLLEGRGMSTIVELSASNFEQEVLQSSVPVLVDFWAPWCAPCRMQAPILEKIAAQFAGRAKVAKLNVDEAPEMANQYAIRGIPTLFIFDKGQIVQRFVGVQPESVLAAALEAALGGKSN